MKYLIIGAGSIGSLLGVKLALQGNNVEFIVKKRSSKRLIENNGIDLFEGSERYNLKTHTHIWENLKEVRRKLKADYVILATKSRDALKILPELKEKIYREAFVVTVQNGILPHIEASDIFEDRHIILSLREGAYTFDLHKVRHAGSGLNILTSFNAPHDALELLKDSLEKAGFQTEIRDATMEILYKKLLFNCVINPLTALLGVKNGQILSFLKSELVGSIISEILEVFEQEGVNFDKEEILKELREILKSTRDNKSSMLQDFEWKRKTEIDFLNGFIIEKAREYGIDTPSNRFIYELIEQMEVIRGAH